MFTDRVGKVGSAAVAMFAISLMGYQAMAVIGICCNNTYTWRPGGLTPCSGPAMSSCDLGAPQAPPGKPGNLPSGLRSQVCTNYAQGNSANWFTGPCTIPPIGGGWVKIPGDDGKNPPSCCWVKNPTITPGAPYGMTQDCKGDPCP